MRESADSAIALLSDGFFGNNLETSDPDIANAIANERQRLNDDVELIASENIVSRAVLEAQGSVMTNKYAEGYPARRYYGGCQFVDMAEQLAIDRVKKLFNCNFANVQPHSGSQANQAAFMALLKPGDTILGMALDAGGHLTHGAPPNQSGKWFNAIHYGLVLASGRIDYDQVENLAKKHKPKLIIAGGSGYSRAIDFGRFRTIADKVGAYLMIDMAHFAGLVAVGAHPDPLPYGDVITSTTHKTLRGPRGGIVLTNDPEIAKKINSSVFPGLQGGPLMHVIAGKAVAFGEALRPEFKLYIESVVKNAGVLCDILLAGGFDIVSGGTDTHLMLVDLRPKNITGKLMERALERVNITCNKNAVPNDPQRPTITSGIRLGTSASTSRGFGTREFKLVGEAIVEVANGLTAGHGYVQLEESKIKNKVAELVAGFPIY